MVASNKLNFFERLNHIIADQGWGEYRIPIHAKVYGHIFNKYQIKALEYCDSKNEKLKKYSLSNPRLGLFKKVSSPYNDPVYYQFSGTQDPLFNEPYISCVLEN